MPGYDGLELDNGQGVLPVIRQRSSGACPRPGGEGEPVEPFRGRQALQSAQTWLPRPPPLTATLTATVTATAVDAQRRGGRPWNLTAIRTLAPYTSLDAGGRPWNPGETNS